MITFLDGPAKGQSLTLERIPKLLRVVRSFRRQWDALDQLDDEPKRNEVIVVYVREDNPPYGPPSRYHIKGSRGVSGFYWRAHYRFFRGLEPDDTTLRNTHMWRKWAESQVGVIT